MHAQREACSAANNATQRNATQRQRGGSTAQRSGSRERNKKLTIKNNSFPPKIVNLVPQAFIVRQGLIKLDQGLVEPVLQDADLPLDVVTLLAGGVRAAHLLPLEQDGALELLDALV